MKQIKEKWEKSRFLILLYLAYRQYFTVSFVNDFCQAEVNRAQAAYDTFISCYVQKGRTCACVQQLSRRKQEEEDPETAKDEL